MCGGCLRVHPTLLAFNCSPIDLKLEMFNKSLNLSLLEFCSCIIQVRGHFDVRH